MNRLARRIALLAIAVVAAFPQLVVASSCSVAGPPCEAAWTASAIFTATVRQIEPVSISGSRGGVLESKLVTLEVERGLLNAVPGVMQVMAGEWGGGHGFEFVAGRRYLVYANAVDAAPYPVVSRCSRTRLLADAAEDLRYLTRLPDPAAGARVFGRVTEWRRTAFDEHAIDYGPFAGLKVHVRGAGFHREALTDRNGAYEIGGLPVGPATIDVDTPPGVDRRYLQREVTLRDARGCSQRDFQLTYSAIVTGRVVDAEGRPIAGARVDAVDFELAGHRPPAYQHPARTDAEGRFTFETLPPGRYVFGLALTRPLHGGKPPEAPAIYLPGTTDLAEAPRIDVAAGDEIDLGDLRLPN